MSDIEVTTDGFIQEVIINRPSKKNSLTVPMYAALADAFEAAQTNPRVRVLLLRGAGDGFCAGNDLGDFKNADNGAIDRENRPSWRFLQGLVSFEKIYIAAVHGPAIGVGLTMLLHADFVYAARDARLQTPFTNLGVTPEAGSSYLLPRRVGQAMANDILLRGAIVSGERAAAIGLVTEAADTPEATLALARERAAEIAAKPPAAVRLTKMLTRPDPDAVRAQMKKEAIHFGDRLVSAEAKEAFTAFAERRKPDFTKFD